MASSITYSRLDISGTWDLPEFATPGLLQKTLTITLDLHNSISFLPTNKGHYNIIKNNNDTSPNELLLHTLNWIKAPYGDLSITSNIPIASGLGGSSSVVTGIIKAVYPNLDNITIAKKAHSIERDFGIMTGLQDQCASLFGGVNLWEWDYSGGEVSIKRNPLPKQNSNKLSGLITVGYTGMSHNSTQINEKQIESFSKYKELWVRILELADEGYEALLSNNISKFIDIINEEHDIRSYLVPERTNPLIRKLCRTARMIGGSFACAGAGGGGCVWSICETKDKAIDVKNTWDFILLKHSGYILNTDIKDEI